MCCGPKCTLETDQGEMSSAWATNMREVFLEGQVQGQSELSFLSMQRREECIQGVQDPQ